MLLVGTRRRGSAHGRRSQTGSRGPLVANFAAVGVFVPLLVRFAGSSDGATARWSAAVAAVLAVAGAALVLRSRAALGASWSLAPAADEATGLVTSGPYRVVRHPIYLGFAVLSFGQAVAFGSWPALAAVLAGVVPTFAWRARAEERCLSRTFGARYAAYQQRTRLIVPYLW
jgi:protein-S-isoprenylcysteine O-methyltransferase Ste14